MTDENKQTLSEALATIFTGTELTEEGQTKIKVIFEAALSEERKAIQEEVEQKYEALLEEAKVQLREETEQRVDQYLTYAAEEWMKANALAVERGIRLEMMESFVNGLKALFEDHNIEMPEGKANVIQEMTETLETTEAALNEQIERNVALTKELSGIRKAQALAEATKDLPETQAERIRSLAEEIAFTTEEEFGGKVKILREAFAARTTVTEEGEKGKQADNFLLEEKTDKANTQETTIVQETNPFMESVLRTLTGSKTQ